MFSSMDLKEKREKQTFYWNDKKKKCNIYLKSSAKVMSLKCEIKYEYFLKDFVCLFKD